MTDPDANEFLKRLQADPAICGRQVCMKGFRTPLPSLEMLAVGDTIEEVLAGYPTMTREDINPALAYGPKLARERILLLAPREDQAR